MKQSYSSPVLDFVLVGQTDVIRTSYYESKDIFYDDIGDWE